MTDRQPRTNGSLTPRPTQGGERLAALDGLRGFALAGVLLANLPLFAGDPYMSDAERLALPTARWDATVGYLLELLVENKFMGLFAILFGVGTALQLERARAAGDLAYRRYWRRLGALLAIGLVHGWLAWCWDILRFYALWGALLPWFARRRQRSVLAAALVVGAVIPALWYGWWVDPRAPALALPAATLAAFAHGSYLEVLAANWAYDWHLTLSPTQGAYQAGVFGRILFGLWLGHWLSRHGTPSPALLRRVALWTLPCGLMGSLLHASPPRLGDGGGWVAVAVEAGTWSLTLFYLSAVPLVFHGRWGGRWLAVLAPVGRMSLSNYLVQTLAGLWLFYGFLPGPGLIGEVGIAALVPIWLAVFALQVVASCLWLRRFSFGPCEWLWRWATYGAPPPWRRPLAATPAAGAGPRPIWSP